MSYPFDSTLKEILGQSPADLAGVFRLPSIEPARALNVDLSTLSAATDIAIGFGDPVREIVDLNFQSGPDQLVDARLLLYNSAFFLRFSVPVRSVLVLLRPKADSSRLNGNLSYASGGKRVKFEYDLIRLWKQPVQPYLEGGIGLLPLAPLCKMPPGRPLAQALRSVVREIDDRLEQEKDRAQAARLMTAACILTGMRVPKETLSGIYDGVKIMHESTAYDFHQVLLRLGRLRFGDPDAKIESSLKSIQDVSHLGRMTDVILAVKSWKQIIPTGPGYH